MGAQSIYIMPLSEGSTITTECRLQEYKFLSDHNMQLLSLSFFFPSYNRARRWAWYILIHLYWPVFPVLKTSWLLLKKSCAHVAFSFFLAVSFHTLFLSWILLLWDSIAKLLNSLYSTRRINSRQIHNKPQLNLIAL